jgi:hypothetical protein
MMGHSDAALMIFIYSTFIGLKRRNAKICIQWSTIFANKKKVRHYIIAKFAALFYPVILVQLVEVNLSSMKRC